MAARRPIGGASFNRPTRFIHTEFEKTCSTAQRLCLVMGCTYDPSGVSTWGGGSERRRRAWAWLGSTTASIADFIFYMLYIFLIFSCHCHSFESNRPALHSLIVRLVSYIGCGQSPATFTISSAYTSSTARPPLHYHPHNVTPQEDVKSPYPVVYC